MRPGSIVELIGAEFHHAVRVHRSQLGEEVELFDGKGHAFLGRIESIANSSASITILDALESRESDLAIHLALALIQPERFEMALQKATELGVRRFIPLITERTEVRGDRIAGKMDRWRKIILEGVKQSGRASLPDIDTPVEFTDAVRSHGPRIIFDADSPPDDLQTPSAVTLFIGPEGGWTPGELDLARRRGCSFQSLGPRRLRAETAAIAAVTLIGVRFGDLGPRA